MTAVLIRARSGLGAVKRARSEPIYRNSAFLVAATVVNSGGGFLFWQIWAHLLPAGRVGVGTALVSASVLAANIGLVGMHNSVIRYVNHWAEADRTIDAGLTVVAGSTTLVAAAFALVGPSVSRSLASLTRPADAALFVVCSVVLAVNLYADQVFVALRSTGPVLARTLMINVGRLALPPLIASAGGFGVYTSYCVGAGVSTIAYVIVLRRRFGISTRLRWSAHRLAVMWRFSAATYVAVLLASLPMLVMPVLVSLRLDPSDAAYFFVAFMLSAVVAVIPQATTRSLFAEGAATAAAGPAGLQTALRQALRATAVAQAAAIAAVVAGGYPVLALFGADYERAYPLLVLLCLATVFGAANQIGSTLLALHGRLRDLCLMSGIFCVVVLGSAWAGLAHGLSFAGVAWIAGEGACSLMYTKVIRADLRVPTATSSTAAGGQTA